MFLLFRVFGFILWRDCKKGAADIEFCAASDEVSKTGGMYFMCCSVPHHFLTPSKLSQDQQLARKLWQISEELISPFNS